MHTTTRAFAFALTVVAAAAVVGCGTPARHTILWPSTPADTAHVAGNAAVHDVHVARVDVPNRLYVGRDGRTYEITPDTIVYERLIPVNWDVVQPGAHVVILQGPVEPGASALPRQ